MQRTSPVKDAVERCMVDSRFKRWFDTLSLKNEDTAMEYARRAVRAARVVGLDPISYVAVHAEDPDRFDDVTQDIANEMVRQQKAMATIRNHLSALSTWARWCRCKPGRDVVIGRAPCSPVASKQRIPMRSMLRRVLAHLDARTRVCLAFRAFAGIRPGILGNTHGTNGLRLRDIKGLSIEDGHAEATDTVLKINVPAELSKNRRAFFSFLGPEGVEYLMAYLHKRAAQGEHLTPDRPVVVPAKSADMCPYGFVQRDTLTDPVSKAMKAAGLPESPYVWRSYFKTQLLVAQSQKGLLGEYVEFWMGHAGGIQAVYSFHKELNDQAVQEIRAAYEEKALPYLETREQARIDSGQSQEWKRVLLDSFNVPEDEISRLDLEKAEPAELSALMQRHQDERLRRMAQDAAPKQEAAAPALAPVAAGARQMVVPVEQVQAYVGLGWRYVYEARLPEGQALVEGPGAQVVA